jgi:hypothetical protein
LFLRASDCWLLELEVRADRGPPAALLPRFVSHLLELNVGAIFSALRQDPLARSVVPDGEFLGPPWFIVIGNTAGFMRIATTAEAVGTRDHNHKAIDQIG